jgi:hypothetical protein
VSSQESSYSFTTKIANDLFTIRGDTFDELVVNLSNVSNVASVKHLIDILTGAAPQSLSTEQVAVTNVTAAFDGTFTSTPTPPSAVVSGTPSLGGKSCSHGPMTPRQGTGKDGKIWRGYFCNAAKDAVDKCKNIYIYPSMPEWHTFVAG